MRSHFLLPLAAAACLLTACTPSPDVTSDELDALGIMEGDITETETETVPDESANGSGMHFHAKTLDGTELTEGILSGCDVTMLNIWQTTCPPCIAEMPEIEALAQELPENVQVLTWCLDGGYETETAQRILDSAGYTHPTIVSADGDMMTLLSTIMYTPTTVFFDSAGNQIGEPIIGSAEDAKALYRGGINTALSSIGKDALPE